MSEKRRALGRGLGALIPSGTATTDRPVDVFFRDQDRPVVPAPGPGPGQESGEVGDSAAPRSASSTAASR